MKKLLSKVLTFFMMFTMVLPIGIKAYAETVDNIPVVKQVGHSNRWGVEINNVEEFKYVAANIDEYLLEVQDKGQNYMEMFLMPQAETTPGIYSTATMIIDGEQGTVYDLKNTHIEIFNESNNENIVINSGVTLKCKEYKATSGLALINNGILICDRATLMGNGAVNNGVIRFTAKEGVNLSHRDFLNAGGAEVHFASGQISDVYDTPSLINNGKIYSKGGQLYDGNTIYVVQGEGIVSRLKSEIGAEENGSGTGSTPLSMTGSEIPGPTYVVTIPERVDFGTIKRTIESNIEKRDFNVSAENISNLFANQKKLVVTVSSANDFKISDGTNNIKYHMYKDYTDGTNNTPISGNLIIEKAGSIDVDSNLSEVVNGAVTVDTSNIKKAGVYSDTLTFTVSLQEVN